MALMPINSRRDVSRMTDFVLNGMQIVSVSVPRHRLLAPDLHFASFGKIDRRVEDYAVAWLEAIANFYLGSQITRHGYFADMDNTVVNHYGMKAFAVEHHCLRRDEQHPRWARNVQLHCAIGARLQRSVEIWEGRSQLLPQLALAPVTT
jgi:hypothetical protein